MPALIMAAYVAFGFSAIGLLTAISLESVVMIVGAVQLCAVAVFFLGMSRIVELLSDIRSALSPAATTSPAESLPNLPSPLPRSATEIAADIERMRSRT